MRKILTILLVILMATTVSAQLSKVGSAGAQFLKIDVGSRYQAMGGAGVSTARDVYSMYWNPAGLADIESSEIGFTNVNWVLDISLNYVAYARYFEDVGVFGASVTALSMDDQAIYNYDNDYSYMEADEYYSASSYAAGITFARRLTTRFSFGVSVKYITEKIHLESASGWAFDFGTQLETGFKDLRIGMSISNMGSNMSFEGPSIGFSYDNPDDSSDGTTPASLNTTPYDLPLLFRMGAAYDINFNNLTRMTVAAELHHPNDHEQQGAFGAEIGYNERYFLRGGYKVNFDEEDLSLGAGIIADVTSGTELLVDYSWQDLGRLQSSHRFSIGFSFY